MNRKENLLPKAARRKARTKSGGFSNLSLLVGLLVVFNVIGLVMVLSASSVDSIRTYGSPWVDFTRESIWVVFGAIGFLIASRINYRSLRRFAGAGLVVSLLGLVVVLVPGIGQNVLGSSRWVGIGFLKVQPSEIAKLALVVFCAALLSRRYEKLGDWRLGAQPVVVVLAAFALLVMKQPDMGTTMILCAIAFGSMFLAGVPSKHLALLAAITVPAGLYFALSQPYRRARMTSFIHPFANRSGTGYQVVQSLAALANGRVMGQGLGASRAKWGALPNPFTDFIMAIIGEELGLIGTIVIVGLFALLAVVGFRIARRAPDLFGTLLVGGIMCWVITQAVLNMGAVISLLPVTGVPLPFISYGGSALMMTMLSMGIVANVASQEEGRKVAIGSTEAIAASFTNLIHWPKTPSQPHSQNHPSRRSAKPRGNHPSLGRTRPVPNPRSPKGSPVGPRRRVPVSPMHPTSR